MVGGAFLMLTQADVKRIFHYDPITGFCIRVSRPSNRVKIGDNFGCMHKYTGDLKYLRARVNDKLYRIHRLIWLYMTGKTPENDIDHIDGNGLNNTWANLREVTRSDNNRNTRIPRNNTSGQMGVSFFTKNKKWIATIQSEVGVRKYLGAFDSREDAIAARLQAEETNGYHENHGR